MPALLAAIEELGHRPDRLAQGLREPTEPQHRLDAFGHFNSWLAETVKRAQWASVKPATRFLFNDSEGNAELDATHLRELEQRSVSDCVIARRRESYGYDRRFDRASQADRAPESRLTRAWRSLASDFHQRTGVRRRNAAPTRTWAASNRRHQRQSPCTATQRRAGSAPRPPRRQHPRRRANLVRRPRQRRDRRNCTILRSAALVGPT